MKLKTITINSILILIFSLSSFSGCQNNKDLLLNESVCVETKDYCSQIIKEGTKLPTSFSETYVNAENNQDQMQIAIYQGESNKLDSNRLITTHNFPLTQPNEVGKERIQVTIIIDESKKITLITKDLETGKQEEIIGGIVN